LEKIEKERTIADIEGLLQAGKGDNDAARQAQRNCEKRICALGNAIDEANDALEWPTLVSDTQTLIREAHEIANSYGNADSRRILDSIEVSIRQAIEMNDSDLLNKKRAELHRLSASILAEQPGFWVGYLAHLVERKCHMRDQNLAERIIAQGHRAQDQGDLEGLKASVFQLIDLLPEEEREQVRGYGSTVLRMNES
jgi:HPt (histidine-containing phosphotransfer) domain-containing protein